MRTNTRFICFLIALVACMVPAMDLLAQTAPAGNAHPQTQMLGEGGFANPFGEPTMQPSAEQAAKIAFSARVDLGPLRDLAVYHGGRLKILDSLARETVADLTGRRTYQDLVAETADGVTRFRKVNYDPLFTFLDVIIDPSYYADKPLLGVNYLPLREAFLERVFPGEETHQVDVRETWKRLGRLTPMSVAKNVDSVTASMKLDGPLNQALGQLREAFNLYLGSANNLLVIPVADPSKPWMHPASLPADSVVPRAMQRLGAAWRAGDAGAVNEAVLVLAAELPKLSPAAYPTTRRTIERLYNASNPFEWGSWCYAGALVSLLLAFGTGRAWLRYLGMALLIGGVAMHAFGFGARCYIAERFAIQNQFESMTGVSLFAAIVGLTLALVKRQWLFGAAVAAVGFMVLITATQTGIPGKGITREAAILNTSVLLKYHVTTVLFSYGLISLAFVVSLFYLVTHYSERAIRSRTVMAGGGGVLAGVSATALGIAEGASLPPTIGRERVLSDLDKAQVTLMQLAFWTLGVGILLGAWWADHSWGRWWAFDPKELWALLTWIVYLIVIHVRVAGVSNRGLVTAWLGVAGFCVMLFCYFGVNLLLPGLHAYA